jgi:tetratricopeptide (TPR) repeat protein
LRTKHVDVAKSYNNLAKGYRNAGYLGKAKDYYEQALMIQKEQFGRNHVDVAESYNKRAKVYRINTSDLEKAKHYYYRSLEIRKGTIRSKP